MHHACHERHCFCAGTFCFDTECSSAVKTECSSAKVERFATRDLVVCQNTYVPANLVLACPSGCNNPIRSTWQRCPHCLLPANPEQAARPNGVHESASSVTGGIGAMGGSIAANCLLKSSFTYDDADEVEFAGALHGEDSSAHAQGNEAGVPARKSEAQGKRETAETDVFDVGLLWLVHNDKMVVAGFDRHCRGREQGIRPGDILRAVDGVDCLGMKMSSDGFHEAEALLLGNHMSSCTLTLMRANQDEGSVRFAEFTTAMTRGLQAVD